MTLRILGHDPSAPKRKPRELLSAIHRQRRLNRRAQAQMGALPCLNAPELYGAQLVAILDAGRLVWADESAIDIKDLLPVPSREEVNAIK